MRCDKLMEQLEQLAPVSYACDWDNPGLLVGRSDKEIKRVLVALDASYEVIQQACDMKADFLLTHHPLIFKPMKQINDSSFIGNRVIHLLQKDICAYAMHTNFDVALGGMADLAAERMELVNAQVLDVMGENEKGSYGIGKNGLLKKPMGIEALAKKVKADFALPFVTVYGAEKQVDIQRIALVPGSGKGYIAAALEQGCQAIITGDIGYHEGTDAASEGLTVIDAGHYGLEHIFMDFMVSYLENRIGGLEVKKARLSFPSIVI